jgi:DNA-binding NarL/FixJ family response regulator
LEIVALTDDSSSESVLDSFRAGAHGIISRDKSPDELLICVCGVYQGQIWATTEQLKLVLEAYSQESVRSMVDKHASDLLSKRELEVIRAVARGLSNRQIAAHLRVSEHTVKNQLFRIFSKLGISSRTELVLFALNSRNAI